MSETKPLPRLYKPGEYAKEERSRAEYSRDYHERFEHAKRCYNGVQFARVNTSVDFIRWRSRGAQDGRGK